MNKQNLEKLKEITNVLGMSIIKIEDKNIHLISNDGYKHSVNKYALMSRGMTLSHKFRNTNIYKFDNMELELNKNNPYNSKILYDSYSETTRGKMKFICGCCEKEFVLGLHDFFKSEYRVCGECYHSVQNTRLTDTNIVKEELNSLGLELLDDKFLGYHKKMNVIDKEGYKGNIWYKTIKANGNISRYAKYNKFALENLRLYFSKNGINCIVPSQKYLGWDFPINLVCECGKNFTTSVSNIICGDKIQCNDCSGSKSNNEKVIENWLDLNHIEYINQYSYSDCLSDKANRLYFDFYLEGIGIIEVDGEGHFSPVRFNGMDIERAESLFEKSQKRDLIKDEYCKNNNIRLLRISYIDINNGNYKNILSSFIFA